jgi:cytochrome c-type biogenesis protein CcmH/NrfG
LDQDPNDAEAHLYMGKILWDTGGPSAVEKALEEYRAAARLDPNYPDPYREMGILF